MTNYAELEKQLREAAERSSNYFADETREAADAISELRHQLMAFCGPYAASYARDSGLAPGELHPAHYDILERCGARMDDFRRARPSSETIYTPKAPE